MKKALIIGSLLASFSLSSFAIEGYVTDVNGNVVKNNFGQCWRTNFWNKNVAIKECDPDLFTEPAPIQPKEAVVALKAKKGETIISIEAISVYFDFASHSLTKEARTKLTEYVARNKQELVKAETITVIGSSDRIGGEAYNQRLSERRAKSVVKFIQTLIDLDDKKINAYGVGETSPTTDCHKKTLKENIKCLAPDRRVDVIPTK